MVSDHKAPELMERSLELSVSVPPTAVTPELTARPFSLSAVGEPVDAPDQVMAWMLEKVGWNPTVLALKVEPVKDGEAGRTIEATVGRVKASFKATEKIREAPESEAPERSKVLP